MNYFDLHCDTLYEMFERGVGFSKNGLCVDLDNSALFDKYARITAIWTKSGIPDDDAWQRFKKILAHAKEKLMDGAVFCGGSQKIEEALVEKKIPLILAVEGANLLGGDISRLDELYNDGVRFLTLVWKGESCIGGAWNTDVGLTDFGRATVKRCAELGIIVDVSHASHKMTSQLLDMAGDVGSKIVATHSDAYSICAHDRNLTDGEAKAISAAGGVIGISMTPAHIREGGDADVSDIIRHVCHYLSLGLEDSVCIGADFDGVAVLPRGIADERDMIKLDGEMKKAGISAAVREKIFWGNAARFVFQNM